MERKPMLKHYILIVMGIVLLTFALYTPAYAWLEEQVTPPLAVVTADPDMPEMYALLWWTPHHPKYGGGFGCAFSTDSAAPTIISPSTSGDLNTYTRDPLPTSGLALISLTVDGTTLPLTLDEEEDHEGYRRWEHISFDYTTPSSGSITFTGIVQDNAGNTKETKFYAVIGEPDGDFYINDKKVSVETEIYVTTLTLNIKFKATKEGADIGWVTVEVYDGYPYGPRIEKLTLDETTPDQEWTGTYTLPHTGVFELRGYFFVQGDPHRKMSLVATTGTEPVPPQTYYRFFMGLLGGIFIAYPVYDIYAEKET